MTEKNYLGERRAAPDLDYGYTEYQSRFDRLQKKFPNVSPWQLKYAASVQQKAVNNQNVQKKIEEALNSNSKDPIYQKLGGTTKNAPWKTKEGQDEKLVSFGQIGSLPEKQAELLAKAVLNPSDPQNQQIMKAALGSSANVAALQSMSIDKSFKEQQDASYATVINEMQSLIGSRTDKNYWDGKIETTKGIWDLWINLPKSLISTVSIDHGKSILASDSIVVEGFLSGSVSYLSAGFAVKLHCYPKKDLVISENIYFVVQV